MCTCAVFGLTLSCRMRLEGGGFLRFFSAVSIQCPLHAHLRCLICLGGVHPKVAKQMFDKTYSNIILFFYNGST